MSTIELILQGKQNMFCVVCAPLEMYAGNQYKYYW